MKLPMRRPFIVRKIKELDEKIDSAINSNDFLEAQALERQLQHFEGKLIGTYSNTEMDLLFNEGFPC